MQRLMMLSKIHRATVTEANLDDVGSITIDSDLLAAADILTGQQVDVVDVTNGNRLTTYADAGQAGRGDIRVNGAAAHLVHAGDLVTVIAYGLLDDAEAHERRPRTVFVDALNQAAQQNADTSSVPEATPSKPLETGSGGRHLADPSDQPISSALWQNLPGQMIRRPEPVRDSEYDFRAHYAGDNDNENYFRS